MTYNPHRDARKSLRLQGYDYSQEGAYFVTICVQNRLSLFGSISDGEMHLNGAGAMVAAHWLEIPKQFPNIESDFFVVMPNHFHGILVFLDQQQVTLSGALQWFKIVTTKAYVQGVKRQNWQPFAGKLWQRSFNDRILRSDAELQGYRTYIVNNPHKWADDEWFS